MKTDSLSEGNEPVSEGVETASGAPDSVAANKLLVNRLFDEVLNRRNPSAIDEIVSPDYLEMDPYPNQAQGRKGVIERLEAIFAAFPDAKYSVRDMLSEGDEIAVRWVMTGTHQGVFLGIPATGKPITMKGIDIYVITGGMITSHWNEVDMLGLINQLK